MRARHLLLTGPLAGLVMLASGACDRRADGTRAAQAPPTAGTAGGTGGKPGNDIAAEPPGASPPAAQAPARATTSRPPALPTTVADASGNRDPGTGMDPVRRFRCDGGHQVELVGDELARVTLADGRVIELPRKSGGVAEYRGEALTFDLDEAGDHAGDSGVLGQDEVGGFDCTAVG